MSPRVSLPKAFLASSAVLVASAPDAHAQTLWAGALTSATYTWSTTTNWTGGAVPDTSTESADLRRDWTGAPTFQIGVNTTINGIYWDDTGSVDADVSGTLGATGGATLTLAGTTPFVNVNAGTFTISSPISGNFAKQGGGTLVLSSATLPSSITISAGTLALNRGATNYTLAQALSGAGAFAKRGTGTMTLNGTGNATLANVTGGITLGNGGGIIRVEAQGVLGTNTVNIVKTNSETLPANTFVEFATTGSASFSNNFNFSSADQLETAGATGHIRNTSGNNTLTGTLTLTATGGNGLNLESSGTGAGNLLTVGAITMGSSPTGTRVLSLGGAGNGVVAGVISDGANGVHAVTKVGAGTWTLSGANTFTGPIRVVAGTLAIGSGSGGSIQGAAGITLVSGTLSFNTTASIAQSGAVTGAGSLSKAGSGILTLSGSNTYSGGTTVTGGALVASSTAALPGYDVLGRNSVASGARLQAGSSWSDVALNALAANTTWSSAGSVLGVDTGAETRTLSTAGAISLYKAGAGTLLLSADNTGTGVEIAAGTFRLAGGSLSSAATVTSSGAGTLDLNGSALTLGKIAYTPGVAASLSVIGGAALTVSGSTTGANISVGPSGAVVAGNSSSLDLSALTSFTYSNSASSGGMFRVGASGSNTGSLGQLAYAKLSPSNTFTVNTFAVGDQSLSNDGGLSVLELGAANVINADTVNFGYSNRSDVTVGFIAGLVDPTLRLRARDGSGALGQLLIGNVSQFGGAAQTSFAADVDLSAGVLDANVTTVYVGSADITTGTSRTGTVAATLSLGQGALQAGTLVVGRSAATTGTASSSLTAQGTVSLSHASGTLSADTLTLADNALANANVSGTLNLVAGAVRAGLIQRGATAGASTTATLNWTSGTIGNRSGSDLTIGSGIVINLLDGAHTFDATGTSAITVASAITGGFGLAKTGSGSLVLQAANTFTGATNVTEGSLVLGAGGSLAENAVVNLAAGARFSTAGGASWSSGTLRPGGVGAIASADLGDLTLAGGTLAFDLSAPGTGDRLILASGSTLTLDSGTIAINPVLGSLANGDYDLIDHSAGTLAGILAANPSGLTLAGISSSGSRQASVLVDTGSVLRLSVTGSAASLTWVGSTDFAYPNAWRVHNPISELPNWVANGDVEAGTLADEFYQGDAVAFAGAGAGAVEVDDALVAGAVAVSGTSDYTFTGSGSIAAASLAKSGSGKSVFGVALSTIGGATLSAGELELASSAANATDIAVSGGTLRLSGGSVGALSLSAGTIILSGSGSPGSLVATGGLVEVGAATTLGSATVSLTDATLRLGSLAGLGSGAASLASSRLEVSGSGAFDKALALSNSTLAVTGAGSAVTRAASLLPASGALTLEVAEADASLLLSSAHAGSGDLALTKTGSGVLKLTAANTLGSVTVAAGTLQLGDNTPAGSVSSAVSVASGAWLRFHSSGSPTSQSAGAISGQGNVEWVGNNTGAFNAASSYTLGTANGHSGLTRLTGARANVSNASAFGTSQVEVGAGGQVFYTVSATPLANSVKVTSGTAWGDSGSSRTFGAIRLATNVSMAGNLVLAADGIRISGNNSTYSGVISEEGGSRGLEVNNPDSSLGTVFLTGANTFTGPVAINRNTLSVASLNSVVGGTAASSLGAPVTAAGGVITIGSAASGADLTYTGAGETTDRVIRLGAGTGNSTLNANGTGLLRLTSGFVAAEGANRSLVLAGTGSGQVDGALTGAAGFTLALTKSGAGTWTLGGANALAGGVTVSAGTLNLTGDNNLSGLIQNGASSLTVLSGANTFSGEVTIGETGNSGGTLVLGSDGALSGATVLGLRVATLRSSDATARTVTPFVSINDHTTFGSADTGNLLFTGTMSLGGLDKNLTIANAVTEIGGALTRTAGSTGKTLKLGDGKLVLSGANTFTGTLEVRAGAVELAGSGTLGDPSAALILSGGSLNLGGSSQSVGAVSISTAAASGDTLANGSLTGSSYAVSNTTGTVAISANLGSGTLTKSGAGELVLSGTNTLSGLTVANSGGTVRVTSLAALGTGTISLLKNTVNSGTLELAFAGANTVANAWAGFNSSNSTVAGTPGVAAIRNVSGDNTLSSVLTLTSTGGNGINIESAGTGPGDRLVLAGGIGSTVASDRAQTLHGAGVGLVSGDITNAGAGAVVLNKDGTGTWTLSGNNSHRGTTLVYQGTLVAASSTALGTADSGSEVRTGATLALLGSLNIAAETLLLRGTGAGGAGALRSSGGHSALGGAVTLGAASSVHVEDNSLTLSGVIGGNFALTKQGAGVLLLSGANTHGGLTQVANGVLRLGHASALGGTANGTSVSAGAALEIAGGISVVGEALTLAGTGVASGGALRSVSGDNSWSGNLSLGAAASIVADAGTLTLSGALSGSQNLQVGGAGDLILSGVVGISAGTLTKAGSGTLTLSGDNTFSGGVALGAGTLVLGGARALGTGAVTVGAGATLALAGFSPANSLSLLAGGTLALGASDFSGTVAFAPGAAVTGTGVLGLYGDADLGGVTLAPGVTLSLLGGGDINLGDLDYADDIAYVGGNFAADNFTGNLVVTGEARILGPGIAAGTVKLTAGNGAVLAAGFDRPLLFEGGVLAGLDSSGYAGLLTVGANAVLDVDQGEETAATAARYRVLAGSTLKGSAVFSGAVSVEGVLAPGNSPGTMEFADGLSLDAASVTEWEFDSAIDIIGVFPGDNTDLLVVSGGAFTLAAGATLKVIAPGDVDYASEAWDALREFTVVEVAGAGTYAPLGGFTLDTSAAGLFSEHGSWSVFQDSSGVDLIWTPAAIPEPSTYGLILGGLALAGAALRRRRSPRSS